MLVASIKPSLVVIDSLRAYRPEVLAKNVDAGKWLKELRGLTHKHACAFKLIHHLRKPSKEFGSPDLNEKVCVAKWLLEMEGPRAFVNQTDVRVAVSEPGQFDTGETALQIKWNRRVHGDSSLYLLGRVRDEDGEPAGYEHITGVALLSSDRREALAKLSDQFSFKEAKLALGRSDDPTNKFLKECMHLGVVAKLGRGVYGKASPNQEASSGAD
jgi:hypothetical protein